MTRIVTIITKMRNRPRNVHFSDLTRVCDHYFGKPRQQGTSHRIYRMPWPGNPRVNIQRGAGGMAKVYQVRQVLAAIEKLKTIP